MKRGIVLEWEIADRITLEVLKDTRDYLIKELEDYHKNGQWMHSEDVLNSETKLIPALTTIIRHFGGE